MDNLPKLSFNQKIRIGLMVIRHPRMMFSMLRSSKRSIKKFIENAHKMKTPNYPNEQSGKPMTEGMIYILFSTDEKKTPINAVYRLFWVDAPILKLVKIDSFLISEDNEIQPRHFENVLKRNDVFKNKTRSDYSKIIEESGFLLLNMQGSIKDGYTLLLEDNSVKLKANLEYSVLPNGFLNYYGGKPAISKVTYQQFYDIFGLSVRGSIEIDGTEYVISKGRGIIEQSTGIFSTKNLKFWNWMNFQFSEGALHIFQLVLNLEDDTLDVSQGAITFNGEWEHFIAKEIKVSILDTDYKEDAPCEIPTVWKLETSNLMLDIKSEKYYYWTTLLPGEKQYIADYILSFVGYYKNQEISGKGTSEFLFSEKF